MYMGNERRIARYKLQRSVIRLTEVNKRTSVSPIKNTNALKIISDTERRHNSQHSNVRLKTLTTNRFHMITT